MKEIKRDTYLKELIDRRGIPLIKVITGVRRCGKSYLLNPIFKDYLISDGVPEDHIIYLNLELLENEKLHDREALHAFILDQVKDNSEYFLLLDEIQLVNRFESVLSSFLAKGNLNVYVTGSNSKFLSSDIVTEFRGRSEQIHMYPLSFVEFMTAYEGNKYDGWQEYIRYGGLPLIMHYSDSRQKMSYLNEVQQNIYLKDIIERHSVRNDTALRSLIEIVASSVGSLTNPYKLENTFKSKVNVSLSHNTINDYLSKLEESYIIECAKRFDVKGKQYMDTPVKYYFTDIGIRNSFVGFRQIEENHIMENVIYNELRHRGYQVDVGVVEIYERDLKTMEKSKKHVEIDFVANQGDRKYYIQSALTINDTEKRAIEARPLNNIDDFFKRIIVTGDLMLPGREENGIVIMNILDFLLNEDSLDREMS